MRRNLIFLLILGFLLAAGVAAWWISPRVVNVDPAPTVGAIPGRQPLTITFTRPMRGESVEERLTLTPSRTGEAVWNQAGTTLTFTPHQAWPSGETLTLSLDSGAKSQPGLPLFRSHSWDFKISPAHLVYLWPADGNSNLYTLNMETGESQSLTRASNGVLDFDISEDGLSLYYSVRHASGKSVIYVFDRLTGEAASLIDCDQALCRSPKISPTGRFLAYEWIPQAPDGTPGVRLYNMESQLTSSVGESGHFTENPLWSSEEWLAYYDHTEQAFLFTDLAGSETTSFPNETGGFGSWSPAGDAFVATEIFLAENGIASRHLLQFPLETALWDDFTQKNYLEDLNPVYSPDGEHIAFERKCLVASCWTPGRQLWLMSSDGERAHPLTDAPDYNHTGIAWHPDGQRLTFVRYNNAKLSDAPEIWVIDRSGDGAARLVINGYSPRWLP